MRVGFLKPDHGGAGGFERLVARAVDALAARGVATEVRAFDAHTRPERVYGIPLDQGVRDHHDDFFLHLASIERMDRLRLDDLDVVVATQPPTYLARHPRVVALTYHQARIFYDLEDEYVASGFAAAELHRAAAEEVRAIDDLRVGDVHTWLTGSDEVASRLRATWGIDETIAFRARPELAPADRAALDAYDPTGPAVCVSRHEWPKRTELAAQAGVLLGPDRPTELVGGGSRLSWVRHLAGVFAGDDDVARRDDPSATWRSTGPRLLPARPAEPPASVVLHGEVSDAEREAAYARSGVVVAPALREDYGLTVLEAFARARPVIVCADGGGLVELVEGTGAGLVVEPTAAAIADAVRSLRSDPPRARAMAAAALDVAHDRHRVDEIDVLVAAIESAAR